MRKWISLCESTAFEATPFYLAWDKWAQEHGSDTAYEVRPNIIRWPFGPIDINLSFDGQSVTLEHIQTERESRHNGHGTTMMQALCACADKTQTKLKLIADESGQDLADDEESWLICWYERFGFELTGRVSDFGPYMERFPE